MAQDDAEALFQFRHALQQAISRDPQVQLSMAQWRATQAQWKQARSRWFPTLSVNASQGESDDLDLGLPVHRTTERTEALLRWNVFNGGADLNTWRAVAREVDAAALDVRRAREDAAERFIQAYADAARGETVARVADDLLARMTLLKAMVDRQAALGKVSPVDADTSASSLLEVQASMADAQVEARRGRNRLAALSGLSPDEVRQLRLPGLGMAPDLNQSDWPSLREGNIRWQAAQLRVQAADIRLGVVPAEFLPRVDLQWRQALHDRTTPPASSVSRRGSTVSVSLDVPLGGEAVFRRDENTERLRAAQAEADRVSLEAQIEWGETIDQWGTLERNLQLYRRQTQHLSRVIEGAMVQYESGRRTLVQLVELTRLPFATRQKMADASQQQLKSHARLLALSGRLLDELGLDTRPSADMPAAPATGTRKTAPR
jgi:outer membrane protein TolC